MIHQGWNLVQEKVLQRGGMWSHGGTEGAGVDKGRGRHVDEQGLGRAWGAPLLGRGEQRARHTSRKKASWGAATQAENGRGPQRAESWPGVTVLPERSVFLSWGPTLVARLPRPHALPDCENWVGRLWSPLDPSGTWTQESGTQSRCGRALPWSLSAWCCHGTRWLGGSGGGGSGRVTRPHQGLALPSPARGHGREVLWEAVCRVHGTVGLCLCCVPLVWHPQVSCLWGRAIGRCSRKPTPGPVLSFQSPPSV